MVFPLSGERTVDSRLVALRRTNGSRTARRTMTHETMPTLVEPSLLASRLHDPELLVVDLGPREVHEDVHVPGAVHLDPRLLLAGEPPATGLLPDDDTLSRVLSSIGLTPERHVVAYDDEGGGWAGRLLWTLAVLGHRHLSLLDGGLGAWLADGLPTAEGLGAGVPSQYRARACRGTWLDAGEVRQRIEDPDAVILDVRSAAEFRGDDARAARAGHIPGAVHLEWTATMDRTRMLRLKPETALREMLEARGVTPEREVIVHCQTHHRSSHTWVVLRSLGYPRVLAYPGSWADWGNRDDTPIAAGEPAPAMPVPGERASRERLGTAA
jgi:thiosulfate/3-mercaptopyruvate sulfurtransferase